MRKGELDYVELSEAIREELHGIFWWGARSISGTAISEEKEAIGSTLWVMGRQSEYDRRRARKSISG